MLVHDYPVRRRTREDLEREAFQLRLEWGCRGADKLDVFELLFTRMPESLKRLGLKMVERSPGFMGERLAYAAPKSKRIFYRARLLANLRLGDPEAAIIFLHELVHILLHPVGEKAWIVDGNKTPRHIVEEQSSEWQATELALCLKAPKVEAIACIDPAELANKFGLSEAHAQRRFETLCRQRKRKLPESYFRFKRDVKEDRHSLHLPLPDTSHLNEQCSFCGRRLLRAMGCKYICDGCGNYSDHFQDGDLVGFDLW